MMKAAQVTIGVEQTQDGNHTFGMNFIGDEAMLLPLLGAVSHAERWLNNRMAQRIGEGTWGNVDGVQAARPPQPQRDLSKDGQADYSSEQEVPKEKAIEATEYAIAALQQRVEIMKKSPDAATFRIDPTLLAKL